MPLSSKLCINFSKLSKINGSVFSLLNSPPDNKVFVDDDSVPDVSLDAWHLITAVPGIDVVGAGVGACCVEIHCQEIGGHRD